MDPWELLFIKGPTRPLFLYLTASDKKSSRVDSSGLSSTGGGDDRALNHLMTKAKRHHPIKPCALPLWATAREPFLKVVVTQPAGTRVCSPFICCLWPSGQVSDLITVAAREISAASLWIFSPAREQFVITADSRMCLVFPGKFAHSTASSFLSFRLVEGHWTGRRVEKSPPPRLHKKTLRFLI